MKIIVYCKRVSPSSTFRNQIHGDTYFSNCLIYSFNDTRHRTYLFSWLRSPWSEIFCDSHSCRTSDSGFYSGFWVQQSD